MTRCIRTSGNDRPHIVVEGYRDRSRFDVPLTRTPDPAPRGTWLVCLFVVAVVIAAGWALAGPAS